MDAHGTTFRSGVPCFDKSHMSFGNRCSLFDLCYTDDIFFFSFQVSTFEWTRSSA